MKKITLMKKVMLMTSLFFSVNSMAEITFPESTFEDLDYGLVWFGYTEAEKAVPGEENNFYDPAKPTFIYVHGWQSGTVEELERPTFDRRNSGGYDEDLSQYWLDKGYNVGILYWNQFADEDEVKDAEAKIYTANGSKEMRWKSADGHYYDGPSESVSQLLFESIRDNMSTFSHRNFRIAGHSLGNQLALLISEKLDVAVQNGLNPNLLPDRVALLDPFYSKGDKDYLDGDSIADATNDAVDALKSSNVIIEAYRSSLTGSSGLAGDKNTRLLNKTAFAELRPWYFMPWQIGEKHSAAATWYFWSIAFPAPQFSADNEYVPSAATNNTITRELMNAAYGARQNAGVYSKTPEDDAFEYRDRL